MRAHSFLSGASGSLLCDAQGDEGKLRKLLSTSGRVLASTVDENRRRWKAMLQQPLVSLTFGRNLQCWTCACAGCSGLHFVAAIGNVACTKLFCKAGADLNLCDKDGGRSSCPCLQLTA